MLCHFSVLNTHRDQLISFIMHKIYLVIEFFYFFETKKLTKNQK